MPKINFELRAFLLLLGLFTTMVVSIFSFSETIQLAFFTVTIVLFGIPHGALDHQLDRENQKSKGLEFDKINFYKNYLLTIILYAAVWYLFPTFSLIVFILITSLHFGQIDYLILPKTKFKSIFIFIYGLLMIGYIITSHINQTAPIIKEIIPIISNYTNLDHDGNVIFRILSFCIIIYLVCLCVYNIRQKKSVESYIFFAIQTAVLMLIIAFLPFYLGFAFYFGIWHSILSFETITLKLFNRTTVENSKKIMYKALPFSILAWVSIIILMYLGTNKFETSKILSLLFIGVAILTLPHYKIFSRAL